MTLPQVQRVALSAIKPNPDNPRVIRDERFAKLVQSIKDFPEMLDLRPIVVNADGVVLGGNMRLRACKEAKLREVPVVYAHTLTPAQQREFIIKDNVGFGDWDWDTLANNWDESKLDAWGLTIDAEIDEAEEGDDIEFPQSVQLTPTQEYIVICAEPNSLEWDELRAAFQLGMVRRGGYKEGSPFEAVGIERVLRWNVAKERLTGGARAHRDTE